MQETMLQEMYVRFDNYLTSIILENIPPAELENFIQLNEGGGSKEEIEQFMKQHIPESEKVFADAFRSFKELYLGNVAVNQDVPAAPPTQSN